MRATDSASVAPTSADQRRAANRPPRERGLARLRDDGEVARSARGDVLDLADDAQTVGCQEVELRDLLALVVDGEGDGAAVGYVPFLDHSLGHRHADLDQIDLSRHRLLQCEL